LSAATDFFWFLSAVSCFFALSFAFGDLSPTGTEPFVYERLEEVPRRRKTTVSPAGGACCTSPRANFAQAS
jgi:hypothetical protein